MFSVVTTTELSPSPWWLATTKRTPPSQCFTVCSAVFLGSVSWKLPLTLAALFDPFVNVNARRDQSAAIPPALPRTSTSPLANRTAAGSGDSLGTVLSETVATVSLSAPSTIACSEQLAHSRTTNCDIHLFPINNPNLDTVRYSPPAPPPLACQKTPPPTELQIPATVTTLEMLHHISKLIRQVTLTSDMWRHVIR